MKVATSPRVLKNALENVLNSAALSAARKASSMNLSGFRRDRKGRYYCDEEDIAPLYANLCQSLGLTPIEAPRKKVA